MQDDSLAQLHKVIKTQKEVEDLLLQMNNKIVKNKTPADIARGLEAKEPKRNVSSREADQLSNIMT